MLLAREAVNLDRSPQTEGSLLATVQRSPAVTGTLTLPISAPQQLAVSPDGRTLAVGALSLDQFEYVGASGSVGNLRLYDARTQGGRGPRLTDFAGARAPVYSSDGALLAYPSSAGVLASIAVRDAHTLTLIRRLSFDPLQLTRYTLDIARARIVIAPDGHTIYSTYEGFSRNTLLPAATFLARWSLPGGRLLSTRRIGVAAVAAVGLSDAGRHIAVVDPRTVSVFEARSLRRLSSVAITPPLATPSGAAISPDGHTIAIASHAGAVSFIDAATGDARRGIGPNTGSVASLAYSPDGRAVASTANNTVIIWDPRSATIREVLDVPGERCNRSRSIAKGRPSTHHRSGSGARMGPYWRAELRTPLRAQRPIALARPGHAAGAAAGALVGWHDVRHPPRHLYRRTVFGQDAAATGIIHRQTGGRRHHCARVVIRRTRARRRRFLRSGPAMADGRARPGSRVR